MSKKHHFFTTDNDELVGINTIFKSPKKLLKFSGSSYFYLPTQKYSVHIVCSLFNLEELLPLGNPPELVITDDNEDRIAVFCIDMLRLKIRYENMTELSQIDCINLKQNINDYAMYILWE